MSSAPVKHILAVALLLGAVALLAFAFHSRRSTAPMSFKKDAGHWDRKAHSAEPRSRSEALAKLRHYPSPQTVQTFVRALADPDPPVVAQAARGLARHPDQPKVRKEALTPLMQHLERDPKQVSTTVKFAVIKALQEVGDPRALNALKNQVVAENSVAADAAWAIGRLRDGKTGRIPPAAEDALIAYLFSPIPKIRQGAILGLQTGGTERALAELKRLAADPFHGIPREYLKSPIAEIGLPKPEMIAGPCREAIKAIEARLKKPEKN